MNFEREAKTGETSEGSQEQSNPTRSETTSNAIDAIHSVSTQLQGSFIHTWSLPSLFKEITTKFRSSLKSQSNLSLLLVTIFALIFFMQVCTLNQKFRIILFVALWMNLNFLRTELRVLVCLVPKSICSSNLLQLLSIQSLLCDCSSHSAHIFDFLLSEQTNLFKPYLFHIVKEEFNYLNCVLVIQNDG